MTLKIAGRVVGGLHQRPEYNIPLDKPELALERLPAEVWPQGELPAALAEHVQPLFSTDFARERWVIREGKSEIEIALDRGEVKAGEHQEPICELELELLAGETADLLRLAHRLLESGVLRQGSLSKAARGYHLAQGNNERPVTRLAVLPVAAKASVEQGWRRRWRAPGALAVSRRDLAARQRKSQSGNSAGDSPRAPCPRAVWRHRAA